MSATNPLKILRLRKGSRYVVALQDDDGSIGRQPFWSEEQALLSRGIQRSRWHTISTEVFVERFRNDIPPGVTVFTRESRRGRVESVVLWTRTGIHPRRLATVADAITEAAETQASLMASGASTDATTIS